MTDVVPLLVVPIQGLRSSSRCRRQHRLVSTVGLWSLKAHTTRVGGYIERCARSMFTTYLRVLRIPGVRALFALGLLGSLPLGMAGLALLLNTHERTGSIATAGLVSAAFGLGNAVGIAAQGPLIDRFGHARVLLPASVVSSLAVLAAALLSSQTALLPVALVAGMAYPATISSVRVLSTALVTDAGMRIAAYALLAVTFGLVMVAGPLLVSGIVALAGPATAVTASAALIAVGGVGFAATPAVRNHRPRMLGPNRRRAGLTSGLLTLFVANIALGLAAGARGVSLPAATIAQGVPLLAGIGFAAMSVGDLIGGLAYGAIRWRASRSRQLVVSLVLTVVVAWVAVPASGALAVLFLTLLVSGVLGASVGICMSALLDDVTPPQSLTTAYTSMVSLGLAASAAGNASAGAVAERLGPAAGFGLAAIAACLAMLSTLKMRSTLSGPPRQ